MKLISWHCQRSTPLAKSALVLSHIVTCPTGPTGESRSRTGKRSELKARQVIACRTWACWWIEAYQGLYVSVRVR